MPLTRTKTSTEVAQQFGCTPRYVALLVKRGKLTPARKLPGRTGAYLFSLDELERYAAERAAYAGEAVA